MLPVVCPVTTRLSFNIPGSCEEERERGSASTYMSPATIMTSDEPVKPQGLNDYEFTFESIPDARSLSNTSTHLEPDPEVSEGKEGELTAHSTALHAAHALLVTFQEPG